MWDRAPSPSGRNVTLSAFWLRCHSFITNASLTLTQMTSSIPFALNCGTSWLYRGTCDDEQVGVNAPGSENTTTDLPANTSSLVRSTHSCPRRVLNVTAGIFWPSKFLNIIGLQCSVSYLTAQF